MIEWIRKFGLKIWSKIENHLAGYIAVIIILIFLAACSLLWEWSSTKHSLEMYGWTWLLLSIFFISLLCYFMFSLLRERARLKDPDDIKGAIEDWLVRGHDVEKDTQYFFRGLEKSLNLRRHSSKIYLPILAYNHGYGFEIGKKTFKLTKLTDENSIAVILEQHLEEHVAADAKEVVICTYKLDRKLRWPKGTTEQYMKSLKYVPDGYKVEYKGKGKIVFSRRGSEN